MPLEPAEPLGPAPVVPGAPQRLLLHVGVPKSGTSYLQGVLADNRERLKAAGFVYPFVRREGMFHAAVELRGQHRLWGLDPALVDGTWVLLLDRVRSFADAGLAGVVSHELLAGAAPEVVERVRRDTADLEPHVVVTVRDLARQAVAHWQEEVKNGRPWSFAEFEAALDTPAESAAAELGFWRSQDLLDVVGRWRRAVPAGRLHLVVVPDRGAPRDELWRRFAGTLGLDPAAVDLTVVRHVNDSLGVVELALLRRVVAALDGRLGQPAYSRVVKRLLAQRVLAAGGSPRPVAPPALADRLAGVARGWAEALDGAVPVAGDLAGLVPAPVPPAPHPDDVPDAAWRARVPVVRAALAEELARRGGRPGPVRGDGVEDVVGLLLRLAERGEDEPGKQDERHARGRWFRLRGRSRR